MSDIIRCGMSRVNMVSLRPPDIVHWFLWEGCEVWRADWEDCGLVGWSEHTFFSRRWEGVLGTGYLTVSPAYLHWTWVPCHCTDVCLQNAGPFCHGLLIVLQPWWKRRVAKMFMSEDYRIGIRLFRFILSSCKFVIFENSHRFQSYAIQLLLPFLGSQSHDLDSVSDICQDQGQVHKLFAYCSGCTV